MSKNIVFEGWLTKSPPSKRIWRTKWRRRWFCLRQSGELPGQYFLDYFAERNCRRLKGTIDLDCCEQVDAGLHMERGSNGSLDPKLRGSVFTIQTQTRTYHLEADCEADMEKWVDAICRVCGLRATEETSNTSGIYQNSMAVTNQDNIALRLVNESRRKKERSGRTANNLSCTTAMDSNDHEQTVGTNDSNAINTTNDHNECAQGTGPYIPISECITGVRAQDTQNAFTFDPKNIITSTNKKRVYFSQPLIRINNIEISENESNISEDECKSLNASQSNIEDWTVAKSLTKLSLAPQRNNVLSENEGPPVPPRPPKTFAIGKDFSQKELLQTPKVMDTQEFHDSNLAFRMRTPRRMSRGTTPPLPGCSMMSHSGVRTTDDEDDACMGHSMQYCNLSVLPPVVDRALKPRYSSHTSQHCHTTSLIGGVNSFAGQKPIKVSDEAKHDVLQYLDLDLSPASNATTSHATENTKKTASIVHGKSFSSDDAEPAYKTVDFVKTEAFNITRQDAEASRSNQQ